MIIVRLVVGLLIWSGELVRKLMMSLLMMFVIRFFLGGMFEVMVMFMYKGMVMRNMMIEVVKLCVRWVKGFWCFVVEFMW